MADQDNNRRRSSRTESRVRVLVSSGGGTIEARCVNLSVSGAQVELDEGLELGEQVVVALDLLHHGSIICRADVVRVAEGRAGLRFMELDRNALAGILRAVTAGRAS